MSNEKKAVMAQAMCQASSTAAEFIRSHGEEGFSFDDDEFEKEYKKCCKKVAYQLYGRSYKYQEKYNEIGIEVNTDIDDDNSCFV